MPLNNSNFYKSWRYKIYIQDLVGEWIDFSSSTDINGADALLEGGGVKFEVENGILSPTFVTELSAITLDNTDRWLDGADFTPRFANGIPNGKGGYAQFNLTKGRTSKIWKNKKVKLTIESIRQDDTIDEDELAQFFIKNTKNNGNKKVFNLESMSQKLAERDASTISNGGSWYENANYRFILEKLLKTELSEQDTTQLPDTFIMPTIIERPTRETIRQRNGQLDTNTDTRILSVLGRPPEFTGTADQGNFLDAGGFCTAMHLWKYNTGSVSRSTTNNAILIGVGTNWIQDNNLTPCAGDCIYIDDNYHGNTGYYEIQSVDSDTQITLTKPLLGKNTTGNGGLSGIQFSYCVVRIYMAIAYHGKKTNATGDTIIWELWKYVPGLDSYTKLYTCTTADNLLETGMVYKLGVAHADNSGNTIETLQAIGFEDFKEILNPVSGQVDNRVSKGMLWTFVPVYGEANQTLAIPVPTTLTNNDDEEYYTQPGLAHYKSGNFSYDNRRNYHSRITPTPQPPSLPSDYIELTINLRLYDYGQQPTTDLKHIEGGEHVAIPFQQYIQIAGGRCVDNFTSYYFHGNDHTETDVNWELYLTSLSQVEYIHLKKYPIWLYGSQAYDNTHDDTSAIRRGHDGFAGYYTEEQTISNPYLWGIHWEDLYGSGDLGFQYNNRTPISLATEVSSGFYAIDTMLRWPATATQYDDYLPQLRYFSGQKGAFSLHPGDLTHTNTYIKYGGWFYYIIDAPSNDNIDEPTLNDYYVSLGAKHRLITPNWWGNGWLNTGSSDALKETLYPFSIGLQLQTINGVGENLKVSRLLQPTYIECIDYALTTNHNEILINFINIDSSNINDDVYPWRDSTTTRIYRCLYDYTADAYDIQYNFLGTHSTHTETINWNSSSATLVVHDSSAIQIGDILRIDDVSSPSITYGRVTNIVGNTLTVHNTNDDNGADPSAIVFPSSSQVNVVAREVFLTDESQDTNFDDVTILESKTINSSEGLITYISFLNRNKINTTEQYGIGYIKLNPTTKNFTISGTQYFSNQPEGLTASINELYNSLYPYIYFSCGGLFYSIQINHLKIRGNGLRAVDDEIWLNSNIVIDPYSRKYISGGMRGTQGTWVSSDVLYGISAPTPGHYTQNNVPASGRYYLFKYDTHVASRIPLAQFDGKMVWETLGLLAQKARHVMGFINGDFYFIPRETVNRLYDTPDLVINYQEGSQEADAFEISDVDFNEEEVINICKITPQKVTKKEPDVSLLFKPRGIIEPSGIKDNKYDPNVNITINQHDSLSKSVKLMCVRGGFISQNAVNVSNGGSAPVAFRYIITRKTWETTVYNATSPSNLDSTGVVYISDGATLIKAGDSIEIHITINNIEYIGTYKVKEDANSGDASAGKVSIFPNGDWFPLGIDNNTVISAGSSIIVRPDNSWSDYNYNYLRNGDFENWTVGDASYSSPEIWIKTDPTIVLGQDTEYPFTGSRYLRITSTSTETGIYQSFTVVSGMTYKVSIMCRGSGYISLNGGTFTLDAGYSGISTNVCRSDTWTEIRGTFVASTTTAGIWLIASLHQTAYFDSCIVVSGQDINRDYFIPRRHRVFDEIGDSNVFISFEDDNEGLYQEYDNQETKFIFGDMVEITCAGLSLDQDANSVQVARAESSIHLYGKVEKSIDNPFLTYYEARELCEEVIDEYKDPKALINVRIKMLPGLTMINQGTRKLLRRIDVYSPSHFNLEPGYTFRGAVQSIVYGKSDISLVLRNLLYT